jgi:outer membrane protein, heavy metal efflux system
MSFILPLLFGLAAVETPLTGYETGGTELGGYIQQALAENSGIAANHQAWLASLSRIPQATGLDDPMFSLGHYLLSTSLRTKVSLSQKFRWYGTRRERGARAAALADAAEAQLNDRRNAVVASVKATYFDYAFLHEEERVTQSQLDILAYMGEVIRGRYALGLGDKSALLQVEIEMEQLQDRLRQLAEERPVVAAQLNALLGASTAELRPWPEEHLAPVSPPAAPLVMAWIHEKNPALRRLKSLEAGQEHAEILARKKGLPDITVGIDYTSVSGPRQIRPDRPFPASLQGGRRLLQTGAGNVPLDPLGNLIDLYAVGNSDEPVSRRGGGEDNLMLSIQMNVPIYRKKIKAGVEEAKFEAVRYAHTRQDLALSLEREARRNLFQITDAKRRRALLKDSLIPKARDRYESLQGSYASGANDATFLDVLDSIRNLLSFELQDVQTLRDWQQASAQLEYLMGGSWAGETPVEVDPTQAVGIALVEESQTDSRPTGDSPPPR